MNLEVARTRGESFRSGTISAALHAALLLLMLLVGVPDAGHSRGDLPVQIIGSRRRPAPPVEEVERSRSPSPSRAGAEGAAERRSLDFAPQAQAVAPQIVNPTVIQQAAPSLAAQKIQMNEVAAVVAPRTSRTRRSSRSARSRSTPSPPRRSRRSTSAPQRRRAARPDQRRSDGRHQPARASRRRGKHGRPPLGGEPRSGSSVREGMRAIATLLGSRDGAPLANVNTRVGRAFCAATRQRTGVTAAATSTTA